LAKIALWKILVQPDTQPVFVWWKQVQPVLKQVQPVFALFTFLENTGSAGHSTGHSTGFCTVHLFPLVCCVSQKVVRRFLKTGSTGFGTDSTGFWAEKSKTASFGTPPIYTHSYLSPQ
jgi:hypothetical protein